MFNFGANSRQQRSVGDLVRARPILEHHTRAVATFFASAFHLLLDGVSLVYYIAVKTECLDYLCTYCNILSHVRVTIGRVWIGNRIYWTL
jgi:hypothetical protein